MCTCMHPNCMLELAGGRWGEGAGWWWASNVLPHTYTHTYLAFAGHRSGVQAEGGLCEAPDRPRHGQVSSAGATAFASWVITCAADAETATLLAPKWRARPAGTCACVPCI